jgi:nitroreductase
MIRKILFRFLSLLKYLQETQFWTVHRVRHMQLRQLSPQRLNDVFLASFVRWHGHQTEKAMKHVSEGPENPRGFHHSQALRRYLEELINRSLPEYNEIAEWAKRIVEEYDTWCKTPGAINQMKPKSLFNRSGVSTPEQVFNMLRHRTSVRFWLQEEIDLSIIKNLIEAGLEAPSSCARMGWLFIAVQQTPLNDPTPAVNNKDMLRNAPLIIYIACQDSLYPERFAPAIDVGAAAQSILLAAEAHGLRGCPIYHSESFDQNTLRRQLDLPGSAYVYLAICLGYPDDIPVKPPRPIPEANYKVINARIHP